MSICKYLTEVLWICNASVLISHEWIHCPRTENTGLFYQLYILQSEVNPSNPQKVMSASPLVKCRVEHGSIYFFRQKNFKLSLLKEDSIFWKHNYRICKGRQQQHRAHLP